MDIFAKTAKHKPGDNLNCRVEAKEPGGYRVRTIPGGMLGFLPSAETIDIGSIISSTFVCMSGEKALLTYHGQMATARRLQLTSMTESDNAFAVWADARAIDRGQRAVDLIMPPLAALPDHKRVQPEDADKLLSRLERDEFTGCMKVDSDVQRSRSAALFYRGRAVGCIYGKKTLGEPYRIETSLLLMLDDLRKTQTDVEYYALPDEIVLSLSAFFLGVVFERPFGFSNREYADSILAQYRQRNCTGCLVLQEQMPAGLAFICKGAFAGSYSIEAREYRSNEAAFNSLFNRFPTAKLEAHLLPDVLFSSAMTFGYSLTSGAFASPSSSY